MKDVFISYAGEDEAAVSTIVKTLEDSGISCWVAYWDLPEGARFAEYIPPALEECKAMVLVLSRYAKWSDNVKNELSLLAGINNQISKHGNISQKKPIVPFLLEKMDLGPELSYYLAGHDLFEAYQYNLDHAARRLVEILRVRVPGLAGYTPPAPEKVCCKYCGRTGLQPVTKGAQSWSFGEKLLWVLFWPALALFLGTVLAEVLGIFLPPTLGNSDLCMILSILLAALFAKPITRALLRRQRENREARNRAKRHTLRCRDCGRIFAVTLPITQKLPW